MEFWHKNRSDVILNANNNEDAPKYTRPGSNWRPSACEADVIATRPLVPLRYDNPKKNWRFRFIKLHHNQNGKRFTSAKRSAVFEQVFNCCTVFLF